MLGVELLLHCFCNNIPIILQWKNHAIFKEEIKLKGILLHCVSINYGGAAAKQHCLRRDFAAKAYSWARFLNFHRVSWLTWLSLCFTWICIMAEIYIYLYIHIHISYIWNPSIWDRFPILFYYYSIYIECGPAVTVANTGFFLGTPP